MWGDRGKKGGWGRGWWAFRKAGQTVERGGEAELQVQGDEMKVAVQRRQGRGGRFVNWLREGIGSVSMGTVTHIHRPALSGLLRCAFRALDRVFVF